MSQPLTFTQDSTIHTGFTRYTNPAAINLHEHRLVLAWFEGEPELWIVDGLAGFENLKRFYFLEWGDRVQFQTFTP